MSQRPNFAAAVNDAFRLAFQAVDEFPDRVDRWLRSRHYPYDVLGDQSVAICRLCDVEWPCVEFLRLDEQIKAREDRP